MLNKVNAVINAATLTNSFLFILFNCLYIYNKVVCDVLGFEIIPSAVSKIVLPAS